MKDVIANDKLRVCDPTQFDDMMYARSLRGGNGACLDRAWDKGARVLIYNSANMVENGGRNTRTLL